MPVDLGSELVLGRLNIFLGYIIGRGVTFGNVPPYSYGRGIAYEPLVLIPDLKVVTTT